jgi:hypothetical protein
LFLRSQPCFPFQAPRRRASAFAPSSVGTKLTAFNQRCEEALDRRQQLLEDKAMARPGKTTVKPFVFRDQKLGEVESCNDRPPLGVVTATRVAALPRPDRVRLVAAHRPGTGRRGGTRLLGLFIAQGMVALPSHMYVVPANAFVLVLAGVIAESILRALLSCSSFVLYRGMRS